jgi:hypothetical protein
LHAISFCSLAFEPPATGKRPTCPDFRENLTGESYMKLAKWQLKVDSGQNVLAKLQLHQYEQVSAASLSLHADPTNSVLL